MYKVRMYFKHHTGAMSQEEIKVKDFPTQEKATALKDAWFKQRQVETRGNYGLMYTFSHLEVL